MNREADRADSASSGVMDRIVQLVIDLFRLRIVRYLVAAVAGLAVDLAVYAGLIYFAGLHYLWASVASFLVATLANYVVSVRLVFASGVRFPRVLELVMIYAVSATGLLWTQLILFLCVERFGVHVVVAKLIAIGCVFVGNFLLRRHFIFAPARG